MSYHRSMAEPSNYTHAIEHLEQARRAARLALDAKSPVDQKRLELEEEAHKRLALKVLSS